MLDAAIEQHRPGSFQFLLSRMNFPDPSLRYAFLKGFLKRVLQVCDMEIVEVLFADGFEIRGWSWNSVMFSGLVAVPWTLDELNNLISLHGDRVAA